MRRPPPRSTLFPYTTLFRSASVSVGVVTAPESINRTVPLRRARRPARRPIGRRLQPLPRRPRGPRASRRRSEEHTSEIQSRQYIVCRLLLEKKNFNFLHPFY